MAVKKSGLPSCSTAVILITCIVISFVVKERGADLSVSFQNHGIIFYV